MVTLFALAALAMVVVHMAQPRFKTRLTSAARFFQDLPPAKERTSKLTWSRPPLSLALFLRIFLILFLLLASRYPFKKPVEAPTESTIALWLIFDTSASMTTNQNQRMNLAHEAAMTLLNQTEQDAHGRPICIRLSSFDAAFIEHGVYESIQGAATQIGAILPRALPTDLGLLHDQLRQNDTTSPCPATHTIIFSDQGAPKWLDQQPEVIWRHLGESAPNVGLTAIRAGGDPLTGEITRIHVEVTQWQGDLQPHLTVLGPGNQVIARETVTRQAGPVWRTWFTPTRSGLYKLKLEPGGAYTLDDDAVIFVREREPLRVAWELKDQTIPNLLGWDTHALNPVLRFSNQTNGSLPTILVSNADTSITGAEITGFLDADPLLRNLHFGVVERTPLPATPPPKDFEPVLCSNDSAWIARRTDPPAIYLAGLPKFNGTSQDDMLTVCFFNAVFDLVGASGFPPLFMLTTPQHPEIGDGRLALHPDEGNTHVTPRSIGALSDLKTRPGRQIKPSPQWPQLLFIAVAILTLERCLYCWGGAKWR